MMKKVLIILIASVYLVSCNQVTTNNTPTKGTIEKIIERKTLNIGTSGEQFPFSFKDDNGELKGIDIEIANALAKRMGVEAKFTILPMGELIPTLKKGDIDMILSGTSVTVKRNMNVAYSNYYFKTGKAILTNNNVIFNGSLDTLDNPNVLLAVLNNSSSLDFVNRNYPHATIKVVKSYDEVHDLFKKGEINSFVSDYEICESLSIKNLDINLKVKTIGGIPEYISAAVSPNDLLFLNLVSNFMTKVKNAETEVLIDELWLEYLN